MKRKRLLSLLVSVCLTLVLAALLLPACAPATPEEAADVIAELEDELVASEKKADALEGEVSDLEKKLAKAEAAAGPVPIEAEYKITYAAPVLEPNSVDFYLIFAELANERGGGRIELTTYGDDMLGTMDKQMNDVASGAIEMAYLSTGYLVDWIPWATIASDLPVIWTEFLDYLWWHEQIWTPEVNKELAPFNIMAMPYYGTEGTCGIFSASGVGPIRSIADIKGKTWLANTPGLQVQTIEAFGAKPIIVPWAEEFTAVESGMLDLITNPLGFYMTLGFAEIVTDYYVTGHKTYIGGVLTNLEWWNSLPEDIQTILNGALYDAAAVFKWNNFEGNIFWLEEATKPPYNIDVYFPTAEEIAEFNATVAPVYEWAREEYGDDKVDMMLDYVK